VIFSSIFLKAKKDGIKSMKSNKLIVLAYPFLFIKDYMFNCHPLLLEII